MGVYELDDDQVRQLLRNPERLPRALAAALEKQLPIPAPTYIGAVVETDSKICAPDLSIFIRWASDEQSPRPWILREELDMTTYSTEGIGRVVTILSDGVNI